MGCAKIRGAKNNDRKVKGRKKLREYGIPFSDRSTGVEPGTTADTCDHKILIL